MAGQVAEAAIQGLVQRTVAGSDRPLARNLLKAPQLHLVERGFVDHNSVRSRLERLSAGLECNESQLRQIILLELWLRNRAHDRPRQTELPAA